jgi:phosphoribosylformimino-5-aminoimidazole carboxamide ribotide isomerase
MELIPAIDLLNGQAVRLRQGRYEDVTVYDDDAPRLAASWSGRVPRLHVVDLEGARAGRPVQLDLVRRIADEFGPGVQVGGGVRSFESAQTYLEQGVDRVVLGTAALQNPSLIEQVALEYPARVILAVDARAGRVATDAWRDQSELLAVDLVRRFARLPIAAVLYTDIDRDGMEVGPNVTETARLAEQGGLPVIASGGVGTLAHLEALAGRPWIVGAIVGRAIHEKRFTLEQGVAAAASETP